MTQINPDLEPILATEDHLNTIGKFILHDRLFQRNELPVGNNTLSEAFVGACWQYRQKYGIEKLTDFAERFKEQEEALRQDLPARMHKLLTGNIRRIYEGFDIAL